MHNKLLVILGPTSTGKTDAGLLLAKKLNGEIISADSRQVYKYLDIGTGKEPGKGISIKGQVLRGQGYWVVDGIKIWGYDLVEPEVRFNLHDYLIKANEIVRQVVASGKLPILLGGTGLYIRSLLKGLSNFDVREDRALRSEFENLDIGEIRKRIGQADPGVLGQLNNSEFNNKRRLIRLVEKLTSPKKTKSFPGIENNFDILEIGLMADRKVLSDRIRGRVLSRISQGMVDESKDLLERKVLSFKRMEELGLEYRYLAKFIKGEITTINELVEVLSTKIRQFAKRQMTWFKKEKNVIWFDISTPGYMNKLESAVYNWYNKQSEP